MKNPIKKVMPSTKTLQNSSELKGLKSYLIADCFWKYDREHVARGVAAGLAGCVIPGFQIFYAAILVIVLRGNLLIALLCTLVTNPLTVVPITYFIYYIGTLILRNGTNDFVLQRFRWDFSGFYVFWSNVFTWLSQFGKAYFVGLPVVSLCLGAVGYLGTNLIWEMVILLRKKKK